MNKRLRGQEPNSLKRRGKNSGGCVKREFAIAVADTEQIRVLVYPEKYKK
jgi:hypothetical protein